MTALPDNAAPITGLMFGEMNVEATSNALIAIRSPGAVVYVSLPEARTLLAVLPELIAAMEAGE